MGILISGGGGGLDPEGIVVVRTWNNGNDRGRFGGIHNANLNHSIFNYVDGRRGGWFYCPSLIVVYIFPPNFLV